MSKSIAICTIVFIVCTPLTLATAKEPAEERKSETSTPKARSQFGIVAEGVTSAAMRDALQRLHEAGLIEGRRGSLTYFRWTTASPPKLAHLGLWGQKVGNESLALVRELPDLEHVSLYETNVNDDGIQVLARLPKLRSIAVAPICRYEKAGFGPPQWSYPFLPVVANRPRVTGTLLSNLANASTLESLELLDAQIKSSDLSALASWPKLSSVSLPCRVDDEVVGHLQACERLKSLTLGYREVSPAELECLADWKSLRKLNLIHAQLSDKALETFAKLATVEELNLEDCGLTDDRLQHLRCSTNISRLGLKRNEINGPGLARLVKLKLKGLGLEFNNLHDQSLSHLPQLASLDDLALSYCRGVTDEGIQGGILQQMTHLKHLGLRGMQQVTDSSLNDLMRFGHLEQITIRETRISAEGVARMKQAMPKTFVFK